LRFRHKLSIVLIALVVFPLVATGLLVQELVGRNQTDSVDGSLAATVSGAAVSYRSELETAAARASLIAQNPDVQQAMVDGNLADLNLQTIDGAEHTVIESGDVRVGIPPEGPAWQTSVNVGNKGRVTVYVPLDEELVVRLAVDAPRTDQVDLAMTVDGQITGSTGGRTGSAPALGDGKPTTTDVGGSEVRVQGAGVEGPKDVPTEILATYPQSVLDDRIEHSRLRLLLALGLLGLVLIALCLLTADRISKALTDLAGRAKAIVRASGEPVPEGGDELVELGAALDTMSSELSIRMTELAGERQRLKETLHRYGETLAATHDQQALIGAVLDTAVQATRSRGGRLLLYDPDRGEATEQARIGTARGSRTDLPMVVPAGRGLEGEAVMAVEPRTANSPRPMLTVPILREKQLLGLVTVVDPEDGAFAPDDIETLSGLAVQAGIAIENARLHRRVKEQAVTDELTGIANRRRFFDVLGREFERAQRFDQPLSLIMLDIDDFKRINDRPELGHLAGDAVLRAVAATIQGMIREIDLAARYGGEEFAVLLPQTDLEGALNLAERLRMAVEERPIEFGGELIGEVTASFGVASGPSLDMAQLDLIAAADTALYQSKRGGKNQVSSSVD
jgi:two-component system cell cycle response regulator